jgi:hypothetical protein
MLLSCAHKSKMKTEQMRGLCPKIINIDLIKMEELFNWKLNRYINHFRTVLKIKNKERMRTEQQVLNTYAGKQLS